MGCADHVVSAMNVGGHGLLREELARRNLLERRGVEHIIHAAHGLRHAVVVTHIADVEAGSGVGKVASEVILLGFVAGEDAHFGHVPS